MSTTEKKADNEVTKTFSGQDIADLLNVEGITFRRYIRSDGTRVGRGKRYSFTEEDAKLLAIGFLTHKVADDKKEAAEKEATEKIEQLFAPPEKKDNDK